MTSSPGAAGARARRTGLRTLTLAVAATCGTGLLLAACSSARQLSGGGHASNSGALSAPAPAKRAAAQAGAPAFGLSGAGGTASRSSGTHVTLSSLDVIRTAFLTIKVSKATTVTAQANAASALVVGAGGYVSGEQDLMPPGGGTPQITLQLKIPSAQYGSVMPKLETMFGKQLSLTQHATDVTLQVADVGSRVASAEAAIRQLRALLGKAGSVSALLSVQNEINAEESNLEALLAQQRALAHETSYATVSLVLLGHPHHLVVHHHKKAQHVPGFIGGLRSGWHAFVLAVDWVLTALGSLLPFLLAAAAAAAIAIAARRRLNRRSSRRRPSRPRLRLRRTGGRARSGPGRSPAG